MYSGWIGIVLGITVIWLGYLSYQLYQNKMLLRKLFGRDKDVKLRFNQALDGLDEIKGFKERSLQFVQKVSLIRYNPYQNTGGDQSFSVALLDGTGDGIVISSLHSRAGTRVFAKSVKQGKQDQIELSNEERQVIDKALKS